MLKLKFTTCSILLVFIMVATVHATPFFAYTNQIGYSGTVTYTPLGENDSVTKSTSTPRIGYIYIANGYSSGNKIKFMSDWPESDESNVMDSFFQIEDFGNTSVISASAGWNSTGTDFSLNVIGANATYTDDPTTNDWSRAWMPDQNTATRGTWLDYEITLSAVGLTPDVSGEWWITDPTKPPTSISGTFSGTFFSEARTYDNLGGLVTFENTYKVNLDLSSDLYDPTIFDGTEKNYYYAPKPIPEPATMLLFGMGLLGLAGVNRKKR